MVPPHDLVPPRVVADIFVDEYYTILNESPEFSHKFYAESSQLSWPDCNGVITNVTTLSSINDQILSSDYKNCVAEVSSVDAQASHEGGVLVTVTGSFVMEKDDEVKKNIFLQTFFLARQKGNFGFFILNDVLRVFASDISVLDKASSSAEKVAPFVEPASNAEVAPAETSANHNYMVPFDWDVVDVEHMCYEKNV